jgi:hypothetical protein
MAKDKKIKRAFKIAGSSIGFEGGRFKGTTRATAARKAASRLLQLIEEDAHYATYRKLPSVKFILKETTQESEGKSTFYEAKRVVLDSPIIREIPNPKDPSKPLTFTKTHDVQVRACRQEEL